MQWIKECKRNGSLNQQFTNKLPPILFILPNNTPQGIYIRFIFYENSIYTNQSFLSFFIIIRKRIVLTTYLYFYNFNRFSTIIYFFPIFFCFIIFYFLFTNFLIQIFDTNPHYSIVCYLINTASDIWSEFFFSNMIPNKILNIYYQNVRGLRTKTNIRATISASGYDLIVFTEHWLNDNFHNSEYFDDSYFVERVDRNRTDKKWGGGALIAIKNHISYVRRLDLERELPFENIWVELKSNSKSQNIFINSVYIPPRTNFVQYEKYYDAISEIICAREPNAKYFILGDFNIGAAIEWLPYMNECLALTCDGDTANELINTLALTDLKQVNYIRNTNNRILDLVLTNCTSEEFNLKAANEISKIDNHHPPLEIKVVAKDAKFITPIKTPKLNFFKANYELINYELNQINWINELCDMNVNDQVDRFYSIVNDIIHRFTPVLLPKDDKFPKWFSRKLIEIIDMKNYFKDKYKQTKIECFNVLFKSKRKEIKYELRACERNYTESIEKSVKTNTKAFFAYTKSLNKSNKLPNAMKLNDESTDNPYEIANLFAKHFESVYEPINRNTHKHNINCNCVDHIEISKEQIATAVNGMSENKTNSPDNIPMIFTNAPYPRYVNH